MERTARQGPAAMPSWDAPVTLSCHRLSPRFCPRTQQRGPVAPKSRLEGIPVSPGDSLPLCAQRPGLNPPLGGSVVYTKSHKAGAVEGGALAVGLNDCDSLPPPCQCLLPLPG